ncbi:uncharacterized protein PgNI_04765 [Pyricularia grisea]|uniref:Uncharacterized protein n=1 Tax=Pyricularia grisea TaxID=148305 RepID=A0A6P8BEK3_PYRGI|nr:uncharacterized protein PgNI_04765 [Pyricularia grisea]TLD14316.1 hypothetical protein PgNI_04765 [Pyricularia grisea]
MRDTVVKMLSLARLRMLLLSEYLALAAAILAASSTETAPFASPSLTVASGAGEDGRDGDDTCSLAFAIWNGKVAAVATALLTAATKKVTRPPSGLSSPLASELRSAWSRKKVMLGFSAGDAPLAQQLPQHRGRAPIITRRATAAAHQRRGLDPRDDVGDGHGESPGAGSGHGADGQLLDDAHPPAPGVSGPRQPPGPEPVVKEEEEERVGDRFGQVRAEARVQTGEAALAPPHGLQSVDWPIVGLPGRDGAVPSELPLHLEPSVDQV